ncbi:hypothetical protein [Shewanella gelidii]|uniref:Uncharacterized protein n=1 Tax=Shewanella gelidii TaxID=1642821 RepID=A0A917JT60_9GAMM|nr:hypothetical protein [Shewanella gelidii]MCL1098054.1 hypothetical protein [Shewanella gelidii]GGI85788.1 hypothetical protein GCM10009332_23850 [Shewanella gelidii]
MSAAIIGETVLGLLIPVSTIKSVTTNTKAVSAKAKIDKGIRHLTKGMDLTLSGVIDLIELEIDKLLDTETSSLSDEELANFKEIVDKVHPLITGLTGSDFPTETLNLISKMNERINLWLNLERQMRDGLAVPKTIDLQKIDKAVNTGKKDFGASWVEA